MISKQTLEIRWYGLSPISSNIHHWFQYDCPGEILTIANSRTDYYLWTPHNHSMSLKLRENSLEMKWKDNHFNSVWLNLDQHHTSIWQGYVERWIKWRHNKPLSSDLHKVISSNLHNPWIAVHKKRWQKMYKSVEIEISEIVINHQEYWSLAFEMEETLEKSIHTFYQAMEGVYITTNQLRLENKQCYAYPSLLRRIHVNTE